MKRSSLRSLPRAWERLGVGLITVFFFVLLGVFPSAAQTYRPFDPSRPSNPYGLTDLDGFALGDYESSRWGVWQDMTSAGAAELKFNWLTIGNNQQELESDHFLTTSLQSLAYAPFTGLASRFRTSSSRMNNGALHIEQPGSGIITGAFPTLHLLRKLHFKNYLDGRLTGSSIPNNATKLVMLVHGWNRTPNPVFEFDSASPNASD